MESSCEFKSQLHSVSRHVCPRTCWFCSPGLSFPTRTVGAIICLRGQLEASSLASHASPHLLATLQVLDLSLSPLTDGKTEAQGGAASGSGVLRGGPSTAGSAPAPSLLLPLPQAAGRRPGGATDRVPGVRAGR